MHFFGYAPLMFYWTFACSEKITQSPPGSCARSYREMNLVEDLGKGSRRGVEKLRARRIRRVYFLGNSGAECAEARSQRSALQEWGRHGK